MSLQRQVVEELRDVMEAKGVRQADLARLTGMTSQQLHLIFSCQRPNGVTLRTLERIADGLDVAVDVHFTDVTGLLDVNPCEEEAA